MDFVRLSSLQLSPSSSTTANPSSQLPWWRVRLFNIYWYMLCLCMFPRVRTPDASTCVCTRMPNTPHNAHVPVQKPWFIGVVGIVVRARQCHLINTITLCLRPPSQCEPTALTSLNSPALLYLHRHTIRLAQHANSLTPRQLGLLLASVGFLLVVVVIRCRHRDSSK